MRWLRKLKKLFFDDVALSLGALGACLAAWVLGFVLPQAAHAARGGALVVLLLGTLAVNVMGAVRRVRLTR